jgi:predicted lipoprotein with Yx(FWY)xxD motif
VDACAVTWPPILVEHGSSVRLEGVDAATLDTVGRQDGTVQLTLGGWPVYRYAKDVAPADLAGHGVRGTWFAVTPAWRVAGGSFPLPLSQNRT